jgi:hypothetical protein
VETQALNIQKVALEVFQDTKQSILEGCIF